MDTERALNCLACRAGGVRARERGRRILRKAGTYNRGGIGDAGNDKKEWKTKRRQRVGE